MPPQFENNISQVNNPETKQARSHKFLITLFVLFLASAAFAWWYLCNLPQDLESETFTTQTSELTDWKTYRNEEYGFEVKYPSYGTIFENSLLSGFQLMVSDNRNSSWPVVIFEINVIDGTYVNEFYQTDTKLPDYINKSLGDEKKLSKQILLAGNIAYLYEFPKGDNSDFIGQPAVNVYSNFGNNIYSIDFQGNLQIDQLEQEILNSFKFISTPTSKEVADDCINNGEEIPTIYPVSNPTPSVGETIEINGCNLNGFEGDMNIWIVNKEGVRGILYGKRFENGQGKKIIVTLKSPICQKDNSYTGFECKDYLNLIPGTYKIYTIPWAKKSNELNITIK